MSRVLRKRKFTGTTDPKVSEREISSRIVARKAAAEGMVLLKNENHFLPLQKGTKVALYGVGANKTIKGGTGSGDVNERDSVTIYQGMKNAGYQVVNEEWIAEYDKVYQAARDAWREDIVKRSEAVKGDSMSFFFVYSTTPFRMPGGIPIEKADADTAFYILSRVAGEGSDRISEAGDYSLTEEEKAQIATVCRLYKNVVVVINAGGLVDLSFMDKYENIRVLLYIVQPGMEGGNAFADIISGAAVPSGKLTDTWAYKYSDYPNAENFSHNNGNVDSETYDEGIYVGYRYFDTFDIPVRYGFGFGLSYTEFERETLSVVRNGEDITLTVKVTNTGDTYSGKEVVQVYASCPVGKLEKEFRRLVGFAKTKELKPGESQEVEVTFPLRALASYDEKKPGWIMEGGLYGLWVGNCLETCVPETAVRLDKRVILEKTVNICTPQEKLTEYHSDSKKALLRNRALEQEVEERNLPILALSAESIQTRVVEYKKNTELVSEEAKAFVDTLSVEELISLSSGDPGKAQGGNLGAAGKSVPGAAGETSSCCEDKNLASIALADGPAGIRLMKFYHVNNGEIVPVPFQFNLEGGIFCPEAEDLPGDKYYQYCTAIPVGTLLAQTWDVDLIEEIGEMIGQEMEEFEVTLWLAPGMNIHRNPLCGRNFEYYSEDPVVSGKIAAAMTNGVQKLPGVGTTIKHFACNNQEDNRMGSNSILSERTLREIYLKGFEIAVKTSQPMSIMTSYNLINGVHAANNYDLCTQAARNEWGFQGVIMTDWTTTENGPDCTASGCMRAGNDLVMPGCAKDHENLRAELAGKTLDEEELKACISRLTDIIWQSNQYENAVPYRKTVPCKK